MANRGIASSVLRRALPPRLRLQIYRLRALGAAGYVRHRRRQQTLPDVPRPQADAPYDIGGLAPIVLPEPVVNGFAVHFVDRGSGTAELDAFKRLAAGRRTFIDVGAAGGLFAAAFCALTGNTAYAFEPSPRNFARMQSVIAANPELAIAPFNIALGAKAGALAVNASHGLQFRGVLDAAGDTASSPEAETMTVETLDAFVAAHGIAPDFAKVDVEGMELEVLRGGARTFSSSIDALMLELHPKMLMGGASVADAQALLESFGFKLMTLDMRPIADLTRYVAERRGRAARAANLVCCK
ncbi:MAG TPA: FkbM family methyltransferase [Solirubrobacteraceae bacterium]|nr:FkbM family methyltransferase [Solirubrobacteraceae bacterium]